MADNYRDEHEGGGGFMMGLLTGTVLGAGLGMLLAPKSGSELRNQLTEGASSLGRRAGGAVSEITDRARDTTHRVGEQIRGRASDPNLSGRGSSFGSGVGLGSADTSPAGSMTPGSGYAGGTSTGTTTGSTSTTGGSTYTGSTADHDPDRL